ncbi:MAG: tryptophan-rich sensory protein [Hyphomicrobiales bacterium]|nr:tryptophan-rich sensory protein [Hyphomicrobiales bacterium]
MRTPRARMAKRTGEHQGGLRSRTRTPKPWLMTNNPLLMDAPAVMSARRFGAGQDIEGASCLEGAERAPNRVVAATTALVCVIFTSVWGYVFISPDMPGLDPTIDYAWFVPTGSRFLAIWIALTLCLASSFYLVLRASPDNWARNAAIVVFIAQFILKSMWAWLFFGLRAPVPALFLMVLLVACIVASIWLNALVDRRAALLMAPYFSWAAFVLLLTLSTANAVSNVY